MTANRRVLSNANDSWQLDLPAWLPRPVAKVVPKIRQQALGRSYRPEALDVLRRLVCDPRMQTVWHELYRAHPGGKRNDFLHRAITKALDPCPDLAKFSRDRARMLHEAGGPTDIDQARAFEELANGCDLIGPRLFETFRKRGARTHQDLAAVLFFDKAFRYAIDDVRVFTPSEIELARRVPNWVAERLEHDAAILRNFGLEESEALSLERLAAKCRTRALLVKPEPHDPLLVRRHRADSNLRGYVISLTAANRKVFGKPLLGTVATTTNVAFGRTDMTGERVRQMVRGTPDPGL
jgi:hypothetical protein